MPLSYSKGNQRGGGEERRHVQGGARKNRSRAAAQGEKKRLHAVGGKYGKGAFGQRGE